MKSSLPKNIDFEAIHNSFAGYVKACRGRDCGSSCCEIKSSAVDENGRNFKYITYFLDEREKDYILQQNPDWETNGIVIVPAIIHGEIMYTLGNCLGKDGCKLNPRPLLCKIVPFSLIAGGDGINTCCPAWYDILSYDDPLIERVMQVRTKLGFDDNEAWYKDLEGTLQRGGRLFPI